MLKALGQFLLANKEEFYGESFATGATRQDGWIDIEGGAGTLLSYASKARRELPNSRVLTDGDVEVLSKDSTFSAQHILTPLEGVAIHINAFNFPVWGMLEKVAPTFIAGVPSIVKPASQTAYLTELVVRRIVESGVLPEGAIQLISGSVGDLLDHVTGQDVVTFTGSAWTGRKLKSHPAIVENSVRFTMEADSLNASILGPDAAPGTPEFDLFVKEVAREMTVKAGQKCTAIRRVITPRAFTDALVAALGDRLAKTTLGDPANESTRMGPLASLDQRKEVRERIRELQQEAEIVAGNPDDVRITSGDADNGAFLNPVVLFADNPLAKTAIHDVEAFGPVSTVMPYDDLDEAIALAKRGKGSLVASVFTDDKAVAEEAVLGFAAFHGRVLIGNRLSAKSSTGHGSPLPVLVHGGPGRAGGGEEMGGIRGVKHYMQRTAVQGAPRLLSAVTGRWIEGADVRKVGAHPFRKSLAELRIGDQLVTATRQVTLAGHRALRRLHRRHLLRPHGRGRRQGQPLLRRPRRPRLPDRLLRRRPLRRPRPGSRARQLRRRQLALPYPGLPQRHPRRPPHLQGDQPPLRRRARRGPLGLPSHQPGRRAGRPIRRADHGCEDVAAGELISQSAAQPACSYPPAALPDDTPAEAALRVRTSDADLCPRDRRPTVPGVQWASGRDARPEPIARTPSSGAHLPATGPSAAAGLRPRCAAGLRRNRVAAPPASAW